MSDYLNINELVGKTLVNIEKVKEDEDGLIEQLIFTTKQGEKYKLFHDQDCCESVYVEDINGDFNDLLNSPIVKAEESTNESDPRKDDYDDSWTWTFYILATVKGSVTIRWYGTSNGYYSESVEFIKLSE